MVVPRKRGAFESVYIDWKFGRIIAAMAIPFRLTIIKSGRNLSISFRVSSFVNRSNSGHYSPPVLNPIVNDLLIELLGSGSGI